MNKILLSALFVFAMAPCVMAQTTAKKAVKTETTAKQNYELIKGSYSANNTPGILIFHDGEKLMAKIPQQASMALTAAGNNMYRSEKAGMVLEFKPEQNQMIVTYKNSITTYTKD